MDYGHNFAGLFRYQGFSVDLEYGLEDFDIPICWFRTFTTTRDDAAARNIQEYTWGINFYLHGNNQKMCLDYGYLLRHLTRANSAASVINQHDHRMRFIYQQAF